MNQLELYLLFFAGLTFLFLAFLYDFNSYPKNIKQKLAIYALIILGCISWGWITVSLNGLIGFTIPIIIFGSVVLSDIKKDNFYAKFTTIVFAVLVTVIAV
jgi:hypothetical protein